MNPPSPSPKPWRSLNMPSMIVSRHFKACFAIFSRKQQYSSTHMVDVSQFIFFTFMYPPSNHLQQLYTSNAGLISLWYIILDLEPCTCYFIMKCIAKDILWTCYSIRSKSLFLQAVIWWKLQVWNWPECHNFTHTQSHGLFKKNKTRGPESFVPDIFTYFFN